MFNPDATLRYLIARMQEPIDLQKKAREEAFRIVVRLGLRHPMTLAAAMKVAAAELMHGRLCEIEATAKALHARLARRQGGTRG